MKLMVLYGQRKCSYPGEYALEALACMDEVGDSNNPDYLIDELARHEASGEFDRLSIVPLSVSEKDIRSVLFPEMRTIEAAVVSSPAPPSPDDVPEKLGPWEEIAQVGVDTGQILIVDPVNIDNKWEQQPFLDIRQYQHKVTGEILEFRKDFNNYEQIIERHQATMNQLNQTGEWVELEQPPVAGLNYNACCRKTVSRQSGGQVDLGAAISSGYGDGSYPIYVRRNTEGRILQVLVDFTLTDDVPFWRPAKTAPQLTAGKDHDSHQ